MKFSTENIALIFFIFFTSLFMLRFAEKMENKSKIQQQIEQDSADMVIFNEVLLIIEADSNYTFNISLDDILLVYWNGYLSGSDNPSHSFNFIQFKEDVIKNERSLKSNYRFQ